MNYESETPGRPAKTHPDAHKQHVNHNMNVNHSGENPTTLIEWVIFYAHMGWPVFPVHSVQDGRCTCGKNGF